MIHLHHWIAIDGKDTQYNCLSQFLRYLSLHPCGGNKRQEQKLHWIENEKLQNSLQGNWLTMPSLILSLAKLQLKTNHLQREVGFCCQFFVIYELDWLQFFYYSIHPLIEKLKNMYNVKNFDWVKIIIIFLHVLHAAEWGRPRYTNKLHTLQLMKTNIQSYLMTQQFYFMNEILFSEKKKNVLLSVFYFALDTVDIKTQLNKISRFLYKYIHLRGIKRCKDFVQSQLKMLVLFQNAFVSKWRRTGKSYFL